MKKITKLLSGLTAVYGSTFSGRSLYGNFLTARDGESRTGPYDLMVTACSESEYAIIPRGRAHIVHTYSTMV